MASKQALDEFGKRATDAWNKAAETCSMFIFLALQAVKLAGLAIADGADWASEQIAK